MASIYGLTLKGVKNFMGHEGPCFQGNIYLDNKKIGFWSQDSWGGPDTIELADGLSEIKLNKAISARHPDKHKVFKRDDGSEYTMDYEFDDLAYDLLVLLDHEKSYKKAVKKGYKAIFGITDGYHVSEWNIPGVSAYDTAKKTKAMIDAEIKAAKKNFFKNEEIEEYWFDSSDSFIIGTDQAVTLKEIAI